MQLQGDDLIYNNFKASDYGLVLDLSFEGMIDSDDDIAITPTISDIFVGENPTATYISQQYSDHLELIATLTHNPCDGDMDHQVFHEQEVRSIIRALNPGNNKGYQWLKVVPYANTTDENYYYLSVIKNISYRTIGREVLTITITFQCDGGYAYTPERTRTLNLPANQQIKLYAQAHDDYNNYILPTLTIIAQQAGNLTLTNVTDNNWSFTFTGLQNGEVLTLDCKHEIITSSKGRSNILNLTNLHWPRICAGENIYKSNLKIKAVFKFRESIKVGFIP